MRFGILMHLLAIALGAEALQILHCVQAPQSLWLNMIAMSLLGISAESPACSALPVVPEKHLEPESLPGLAPIAAPGGAWLGRPLSASPGLEESESLRHLGTSLLGR